MQPKSILYTCSSIEATAGYDKKIANNSCVVDDGRGEEARVSLLLFPHHYMCTFFFPSLYSQRPLQRREFCLWNHFPLKLGSAGQITLNLTAHTIFYYLHT